MSNPKVYIATKDDVPVVAITTDKHKPFDADTLGQAIHNTLKFAQELRLGWDNNNWFPCGFVSIELEGNSPLIKFIKKHGVDNRFGKLSISKGYTRGYHLYLRFDEDFRDAITTQCMNYNTQVYQKLVEELAYLNIPCSVRSMID